MDSVTLFEIEFSIFLSLRYSMPMRRSRKCIQDCSSLNGWSVGTSRTGPRSSSSNTVGTHKKRNWNKRNEWKWWPMGFQWIQSMEECFLILPAGFLLIKVKSFWKKEDKRRFSSGGSGFQLSSAQLFWFGQTGGDVKWRDWGQDQRVVNVSGSGSRMKPFFDQRPEDHAPV